MPISTFAFELKSLDDQGTFTGLGAVYNNVDRQGDVVMPTAFTKSLQESGKERPLLYDHRSPIGKVKLRDSPTGLVAEGRLSLGVQLAKDVYEFLKDGVIDSLSIGFQIIREDFKGGIRQLLEVRLFEVSLVLFPANEQAVVTSVKSAAQRYQEEIARTARDLAAFYRNTLNKI